MMGRQARIEMISNDEERISVKEQCELLSVHRSGFYYKPTAESAENLKLMRILDEQYFKTPFYGALRLTEMLKGDGYNVNVKRIRRLMRKVNWRTIYQEPKTTINEKADYKYPYLLRNLKIERLNQVWAMDITYVPMEKGFMYLTAIIDLHSRYVVNWSVSNSMSAEWCVGVLQQAISEHGKPDIFNTDQGSQFTSEAFVNTLRSNDIKISMDGKGRALDNVFIERLWRSVKYENVYLNVYENGVDLYKGLKQYFEFYNTVRQHQSLNYEAPARVYKRVA